MSEEMDMPCPCPNCGNIVEMDDMCNHPEDFKTMVCDSCYDKLEEEMNSGQTQDHFGNVLSYRFISDESTIYFSVNGESFSEWNIEDCDPDMSFNYFVESWNKTQAITLRSIKLKTTEIAEFVIQSETGGESYSCEDVELVQSELSHVETHLSNLATTIEPEQESQLSETLQNRLDEYLKS
ncbi:hypothetical protein JQC92_02585 [Shewanella sp. 202IG2-18]|uniref:hypothetical protein n=1 Tax=Parashewanella hymeniacidonis TaxID=2807618 RepID=UPI001960251E|nr:hypothetical protein [Parashewanella hymeniacidonis]MBM7070929.1 hypothetical protein [Parashewanella hymeniacidonis]